MAISNSIFLYYLVENASSDPSNQTHLYY